MPELAVLKNMCRARQKMSFLGEQILLRHQCFLQDWSKRRLHHVLFLFRFRQSALAASLGITPSAAWASLACASISNQIRNLFSSAQIAVISGRLYRGIIGKPLNLSLFHQQLRNFIQCYSNSSPQVKGEALWISIYYSETSQQKCNG